jgi:L-malate glycosyltransferase
VKISFLLPGYIWGPSGGIRVVYEHANRLAAKGHDVTVIHPRRLKYPAPLPEGESTYYRLRRNLRSLMEIFHKPSVDWQQIDPRVKSLYVSSSDASNIPDGDAIFATAWQTARSVLECPKSKGEKFYLIQHYETFMGPKHLVDETWRASLHKVAVSKWLVEVGESLGVAGIAHVTNAIDHEQYRLVRPIEGRRPQIAMTFSKVAGKGSADGIEALTLAREHYPDLRVVMFGLTNVRPSIPSWIEYHSNPAQEFIVSEIYNNSTIFLCPSWSEGYALPPAEAAGCGCAVVSTDNGGIRDYVENGVTGLLSPPRDPQSLASNLRLLLGDEDLRLHLAKAANRAVAGLSWEQSATKLENLVASVVEGKGWQETETDADAIPVGCAHGGARSVRPAAD